MKKCPFCQEEIQDSAIKCRFCGEFLEEKRTTQKQIQKKQAQINEKKNHATETATEIDLNKAQKKISSFGFYLKILGSLNILIGLIGLFSALETGISLIKFIAFLCVISYGIILILNGRFIQKNKEKNLFAYIKAILIYFLIYGIIESFILEKLSIHLWFFFLVGGYIYLDHRTWKFLEKDTSGEKFSSIYLKILSVLGTTILIFTFL